MSTNWERHKTKARAWLSHYPVMYALVGGAGVVLFWRGVWLTADYLIFLISHTHSGETSIDFSQGLWWDGPLSLLLGSLILAISGIFVSSLIGNEIIISGLKGEKRVAEKTEQEVKTESTEIDEVRSDLSSIATRLMEIERKIIEKENHKK